MFSEQDFSQMKYPIYGVSDKDLFAKQTLLKSIFSETLDMCEDERWNEFISPQQLMKYIVYVYHRKSPLVDRMGDISTRKKSALELAGISLKEMDKNKKAKTLFTSIVLSQNEFVNYLSLNFLKFENNIKWTQLVRAMEAWEDAIFQMQQESAGTEKKSAVDIAQVKTRLYQGAKQYQDDINRLSAELMQEDALLLNALSSHLFIERTRKRLIIPEDYAALSMEERADEFRERGFLVN